MTESRPVIGVLLRGVLAFDAKKSASISRPRNLGLATHTRSAGLLDVNGEFSLTEKTAKEIVDDLGNLPILFGATEMFVRGASNYIRMTSSGGELWLEPVPSLDIPRLNIESLSRQATIANRKTLS